DVGPEPVDARVRRRRAASLLRGEPARRLVHDRRRTAWCVRRRGLAREVRRRHRAHHRRLRSNNQSVVHVPEARPAVKRLERLRTDVAFGIRQQLRTPANSLIIVVTLALGIAATSIAFSLVNGFFIRPLPILHPERLVRLYNTYTNGFQYFTVSYPDFEDM